MKSVSCQIAMKGARGLNRILRLTAHMLFERGEETNSVADLLQQFVEPRVVRQWRAKWNQTNGCFSDKNIGKERLPFPPIDWDSITVETLEKVNLLGNKENSEV